MHDRTQAHVAASIDYRTQRAQTFCGADFPIHELGVPGEPPPAGKAACASCYGQMLALVNDDAVKGLRSLGEAVNALSRRIDDGWSSLADQLDAATLRVEALERKAKKGRRS